MPLPHDPEAAAYAAESAAALALALVAGDAASALSAGWSLACWLRQCL